MRTGIHIILRCFWMMRRNICADFDEQLDLVEELYGQRIQFFYDEKSIDRLLLAESFYPKEIKSRVKTILLHQRRKYKYLFADRA